MASLPAYYTKGNADEATETPLTLKRLEPRRQLTKNSHRLVIVLVGLPARGKSFIARKLEQFMTWTGVQCKIFNVGRYRREAYASLQKAKEEEKALTDREQKGACDANFFDASNKEAAELREKVAEAALQDMLAWLDKEDAYEDQTIPDASRHSVFSSASAKLSYQEDERIAIFDATNSTDKRRQWILERCTSPELRPGKPTGVVFVESICDDEELLEENFRYKVSSSPDFEGMSKEEALKDLRERVRKYEAQYETISDDSLSYIKVFNLSTKLLVNHMYGRMSKTLVPAIMAWHIGSRPIFLCRPGQTLSGIYTDGEDYVARNKVDPSDPSFLDLSSRSRRKSLRGDSLGPTGKKFREELLNFCRDEVVNFLVKRASVHDMTYTGTSISGLAPGTMAYAYNDVMVTSQEDGEGREPFPLRILTSTMPRALETVFWSDYDFAVEQLSNLNPLDKGDFNGMELEDVRVTNPAWYEKLEEDAFHTRFPGGECYRDLIFRLTSIVIDMEQQVIPTLVVSHVSVLQCLMAYFRKTPVEKCMSIEVPMHTVIKFTPLRGGGWSESMHSLSDVEPVNIRPVVSESEMSQLTAPNEEPPSPIWGDNVRLKKLLT